jgi:two-component system cell cycle response regulator
MRASVLLVDDERFARTIYSDYLRGAGHEVQVAEDAPAALAALAERRFDLLITDIVLPGADGIELLGKAKQLDPELEVLVITALDRVDPAVRAMKSGASDYLVKPVSAEALLAAVQRSISTRGLLAENKTLRAHLQLFDTAQRLTATLEHEKLVPMALAAVAAECGAEGGVLLETGADGALTLAGHHGLGAAEAKAAADAVRDAGLGRGPKTIGGGAGTITVLPLTDGDVLVGAVAVAGAPDAEALARGEFLCRQLGLALRTAGHYRQVKHLAYLDDLTHLYNTRYLEVALDREIESGRAFCVLFLDLDHLKAVNDAHGHLVGSGLLVEVGRVLKSCVREEDVVVRYGGDEYVALLLGIDSGVGLKVAERIRRSIENHVFLAREHLRIRVTASIGLASCPEHTRDKAEVLDLADRAMYRGKRTTRNVVYVASRDLPPVPVR